MNRLRTALLITLAILSATVPLLATRSPSMAEQGGLSGFVWIDANGNNGYDPDEERAPGASVQAILPGQSFEQGIGTTTDSQGFYTLPLTEGTWNVRANYYVQTGRAWRQASTTADVVTGKMNSLDIGLHSPDAVTNPTAVDAKIEIVWPHDRDGIQQPVTQADLVNVAVYLSVAGTNTPVPCGFDPTVRLWRAFNGGAENHEAELLSVGMRQPVTVEGKSFNRWLFNDIDASGSRDQAAKAFLYVTVDGVATYHNVWAHGADARTHFPIQSTPTAVAVGTTRNEPVSARIQIVWPHDRDGNAAAVSQASLANIAVDLFQPGTLNSVPSNWLPSVKLYRSLNNGVGTMVASGQKMMATQGNLVYPRWVFNDVDVSQATDPVNKYYFYVSVEGVTTFSNIWSHGADARTYFPNPEVPSSGCR